MDLILFSTFLVLYYLLHSLLVANRVKGALEKYLIPEKYYRLLYNFISLTGLAGITWFFLSMDKQLLFSNQWLKWAGILLAMAGLVWVIKAMKGYDLLEFAGIDRLQNRVEKKEFRLHTHGLNAQVRHPLYFGTLLMIWGMFFVWPFDGSLSIALISTLYVIIGARLEEKKLEQQYGDEYRLYQEHVPMLIPFKWGN